VPATLFAVVIVASVALTQAGTRGVPSEGESPAALRNRAADAAYNLDYPEAVQLLDRALTRDPGDPASHRARALATWLHIIFERGSITVDQYLGGLSQRDVRLDKPPTDEAATFQQHAGKALELAQRRLDARPGDVQALFDVGAAYGILASYSATVEGRVTGAFRQARRAFDAHERVLSLNPSRKDAGLVVGTYRYVVSTLSLPMRWMAYLAGFGGDRALGLRLIEEAARYPSEVQIDAKVALLLLYNRERRYGDALTVARDLMSRYPRNRIFWLEAGATAIRARQFAEAERLLSEGIAKCATDTRPRAFGEDALWYYKRGLARLALRRLPDAATDLERARTLSARDWVKARIQLEIGKLADLQGRRAQAQTAYRQSITLASSGNDQNTGDEAQRYLKTPFR
jgi:tetratricopeptide (TPR) repeat protein